MGRTLRRQRPIRRQRRSGRTRKGSKWLGIALEEAALVAARTKNTYLAAQIPTTAPPDPARPRARRRQTLDPHRYWHTFNTGETYRELGGDHYQRRDPERLTKRLVGKLQELGHLVTLEFAAA